jgi:hypothetical protein
LTLPDSRGERQCQMTNLKWKMENGSDRVIAPLAVHEP